MVATKPNEALSVETSSGRSLFMPLQALFENIAYTVAMLLVAQLAAITCGVSSYLIM
jgi:hypothetical protein